MICFCRLVLNPRHRPSSREISLILSFLQELLDKGRSPSTLKVYVVAIAASHAPIVGQSVSKNNQVVRFLKGSRRLKPPSPLPNPYLGSDHCSEGSEGPSLWAATVYWPTIPVTKDSPATGASIGQVDGWFTCTLCEFHLPSIWA